MRSLARFVTKPFAFVWQKTRGSGPSLPSTTLQLYAESVSLVLAVWLAIFLSKLALACRVLSQSSISDQIWDEDWWASLSRLAGCCTEDLAVGLVCFLLGSMVLGLNDAFWYRLSSRLVVYGFAMGALILMAIDLHLFSAMRCFLTAGHIQVALGLDFASYLGSTVTVAVQLSLVLLPLATLAGHLWWSWAFPRFWLFLANLLTPPWVVLVLSGGLFGFAQAVQANYFFETHPDFAQNPHLLLARSCFESGGVADWENRMVEDSSDFLPGRPRPSEGLLTPRPKNIIVIVLESVASPYLDLQGGPFPLTPQLRRLQNKGILFENFYATANHSLASALPLFGSTYNDPQYIATVLNYPEFPIPFASTWLKNQGYKTYFLGAGGKGIWEGFQNMVPTHIGKKFDVERDLSHPFWSRTSNPQRIYQWEYQDQQLFRDAHRVLEDVGNQKFFLMLWNYGTHWPYTPEGDCPLTLDESRFPPCIGNQQDLKNDFILFLRSIYCVDSLIGQLHEKLEKLGLAEDTLIVITADHGETFGQHLGVIHGHSVYEEEVHVPLILLNQHLAHLGPRSKVIGSHVDLWPTILDVCGLPSDPRWQGRSLLGGKSDEVRRAYFASRANGFFGVREGKHKFIWDNRRRQNLLFDLETDPEERNNLSKFQPELCASLRGRLEDWRRFMAQHTQEMMNGP